MRALAISFDPETKDIRWTEFDESAKHGPIAKANAFIEAIKDDPGQEGRIWGVISDEEAQERHGDHLVDTFMPNKNTHA